jgi:hypothetical protein
MNGFASYTFGDGRPPPPAGASFTDGAGLTGAPGITDEQNKITSTRIRSGYLGNIFAFGLKKDLGEGTSLAGYFALWTVIQTDHTRFHPVSTDVRESYLKVEGPWGSVLAGRTLGLFGKGSVEIDFNYAHGYGLGYPCVLDETTTPACGQIGFGVIFPYFAAGLVYKTPTLAGFAISGGVYDPVVLAGVWELTPLPRLEGELTYDLPFGDLGKLHFAGSGLWQKLGIIGSARTTAATGVAGAARLEIGPLRLGFAGHYGKGLGFYYAIEDSAAAGYVANEMFGDPPDVNGTLRTFDGYYAQSAVVLGKVDLAAGYGAARLHMLDLDVKRTDTILPKKQAGINAGVFFHANENLVLGLDYFRADFAWYNGAKQGVNTISAGVTMPW